MQGTCCRSNHHEMCNSSFGLFAWFASQPAPESTHKGPVSSAGEVRWWLPVPEDRSTQDEMVWLVLLRLGEHKCVFGIFQYGLGLVMLYNYSVDSQKGH